MEATQVHFAIKDEKDVRLIIVICHFQSPYPLKKFKK